MKRTGAVENLLMKYVREIKTWHRAAYQRATGYQEGSGATQTHEWRIDT